MADRVRRVSFLVDLRAGTAKERAQVRLVLRRVLTHLSRQSPAPPRWSFRFYDSALTPQRFDARMTALAKASAGTDDKLPTLRRDEFHACTPDVIAAVVRAYDQSVELYNADADDEGANLGTPPENRDGDLDSIAGPDAERTGWFTTLARQMAGVIQRAAGELAGMTGGDGDGDGGGSERQHSAVVILSRMHFDAPARSNDENDPAKPPGTKEIDFLRPFKGIEDAYRKERTRAYLCRLGGDDDGCNAKETAMEKRAAELFARFDGSSVPAAALAHAAAPRGLPPGLFMSAYVDVGDTGDVEQARRSEDAIKVDNRADPVELRVRLSGDGATAASGSVALGIVAVLPSEPSERGVEPSTSRVTRATIVSLVSVDQLSACWVNCSNIGGECCYRVAAAAKGSPAYALGALLAIRRAGAIVEVEETTAEASADRVDEEDDEALTNPELLTEADDGADPLLTQETDATTAAGTRRRVVLYALQPLSPGTMSLVAVAPSAGTSTSRGPDTPGRVEDGKSAASLMSALAVACGAGTGWGALEPIFPDPREDRVHIASSSNAAGTNDTGTGTGTDRTKILASVGTGNGPDNTGDNNTMNTNNNTNAGVVVGSRGTLKGNPLSLALADDAMKAPPGTHRWERWYGDGPRLNRFGDALAASLVTDTNGAGVLSPKLRLPNPAGDVDGGVVDDDKAGDAEVESDAALDARFRAMVGEGLWVGEDTKPSIGFDGHPAPTPGTGKQRRRSFAPVDPAWDLSDTDAVVTRVRSEYDALFASFGSDVDAPDPNFGDLAKKLATDAVSSARKHAASNDAAVDTVEKTLVLSQTQLEARHRTGGCKSTKRREHAFQAHLSLSLHSLRSSEADKKRTKKAAKHLAKIVNPLSFLLQPTGIQALHEFVEDTLGPRYNAKVPKLMAALRSNLGVGATAEKAGDGDGAESNAAGAGKAARVADAGVFSPGVVGKKKTTGGGFNPREDEYGGESGETSEALGGKPSKAPDPAPGFKVPNPKTGAKWHNLFRSRGGAKREVRMAPVKSAEELRKQQDKEELAKKEKEKRAAFLRQRQETGRTREKLLMVPHGFQPTPDAGKRKVMQMPAPRNLALASFDSNPGGAAMTPGRQAAIAMMQTPLPARRRDSVSMTPARGNSRLSEVMSTPAAMSTPRGPSRTPGANRGGSRGAAMLQQAMSTPARETVTETPVRVIAATPLPPNGGRGGMGGMVGFGAMVREGREAETDGREPKRAKKSMFTFGGGRTE